MNLSARKRFILTATCSYLIFGSAWIFLSDRLLLAFTDASSLTEMSTVKGIAFISLTALLLLVALSIIPDRSEREAQGRLRSAELIGSGDHLPRWVPYAFAVLVTVSVLAMRMKIAVSFGERPLLVLFMLPIIFSSVLGGFGPGVLATVIAALGVDYFGIPPLRSLHIREPFDLFQWAILVGTGVLTSYLNELLHRARRQAEERRMQVELAQEELRQSEERFQLAMRGPTTACGTGTCVPTSSIFHRAGSRCSAIARMNWRRISKPGNCWSIRTIGNAPWPWSAT
jgi:hypothetical protein